MTVAVDAMRSASNPHAFMGVTEQGLAAIVKTRGNQVGALACLFGMQSLTERGSLARTCTLSSAVVLRARTTPLSTSGLRPLPLKRPAHSTTRRS